MTHRDLFPCRQAGARPFAGRALVATFAAGVALGGCDARIGEPKLLWTLWLLPVLAAFYLLSFRARAARLRRFATPAMLERLTAGAGPRRAATKAILVTIAVAALLLALARLQVGYSWEEIERRGVDIVIALDVSNSMLVEDAGRTLPRLERAKREIHDLLQMMAGDRVGIVAFAGTAFVQCPMTLDYGAAQLFLDALDADSIPVQGTDLARALETSLEAFRGGGAAASRAILLITDGEDHSGRVGEVAKRLAGEGVRVFAIGIGSEEGAPIPAAGGGFRRDRGGAIILSRLDEPTLQQIALTTNGRYVRSVTGDLDLEQIYVGGIKATLEEREFDAQRRQRWEDRFQWLLGLALFALMIDGLLPDATAGRATRARATTAAPRVVAAAALSLLLMGSIAQRSLGQTRTEEAGGAAVTEEAKPAARPAQRFDTPEEAYEAGDYAQALEGFVDLQVERPEDAAVTMNVGSSHYRLGDLAAASRSFESAGAVGDDKLRAQAWYDLGNVAFQEQRYEDAIDAYHRSLDLDPGDADAKFNLEVASVALEQRQEQQQQQQQQQQQNQQQDQQQKSDDQQKKDDESEERDRQQQSSDSQQREQDEEQRDEREQQQSGDQQQGPRQQEQQESGEQETQAGPRREGQLSPAEAQRLLDSLEEGRPRRRVPPGRHRDQEKDW